MKGGGVSHKLPHQKTTTKTATARGVLFYDTDDNVIYSGVRRISFRLGFSQK